MTVRKSKHGGKRTGAGRPRKAEPRIMLAVSASSAQWLQRWADAQEPPVSLRVAADIAVLHLTRGMQEAGDPYDGVSDKKQAIDGVERFSSASPATRSRRAPGVARR